MELLYILTTLGVITLATIPLKNRGAIEFLSLGASTVALVESFSIALRVAKNGEYSPSVFFSVGALEAIVVLIIACIGFGTTMYSIQYLREETKKEILGFTRVKQYFILMNLFLLAMYLAVVANNPIFAWIFIEATTLSTAFLISFYNKPSAIEGAWKYLILNSIGLLLGFFGTLLYFTSMGHIEGGSFVSWHMLVSNASNLDPLIAKIAFIFVLIGYGTKVGLVPMHTWKPDAYSKAPAPIGSLLSGALMPVAFVVILKFKVITDIAVAGNFTQNLLTIFGVLSIAVSALIIFNTKDYKRVLAYSSIENAGIMAFGFALGGLGVLSAVFHMIYHSLVKASLFFSSGNLLLKYNSAKIANVRDALSVVPRTSILFILGFIVVTGTPPFGIFITKMQILSLGMKTNLFATCVALLFMVIVFVGFLKHVTAMFLKGKTKESKRSESSDWLIIPSVLFLMCAIVLSFYVPPFLHTLINDVVSQY